METAVSISLLSADAFEDTVNAKAVSQCSYALSRLLATLAHHIGGAERFRERDPVGVAAQDDDLFGAEAFAAMTPHNPTAPSPTTATFLP